MKILVILLLLFSISEITLCNVNYEDDWECSGCETPELQSEELCSSNWLRCDGWEDCADGSDERDCKPMCTSDLFQCTGLTDSIHCVLNVSVCDGKVDCEDGSDEINSQCENFFACEESYRVTFLTIGRKCDGLKQCENDERDCPACLDDKPNRCDCNQLGNFTCMIGGTCYADTDHCDGKYDCADWSDEWNCKVCNNKEYPNRCNFATTMDTPIECFIQIGNDSPYVACFKESERCDGSYDCRDNSDEWNCTNNCFGNSTNRCACNNVNDFTCDGQPCFSESERCDGMYQCSDASDEWNCTSCPNEKPTRCNCNKFIDFTCGEQSCFEQSARCDGRMDCEDFSDEWNCTSCQNNNYPWRCACNKPNNFTCEKEVSCYGEGERCDGVNDCGDWSDEINCTECSNDRLSCACRTYDSVTCTDDESCYGEPDRCDNYEDCSDGSDEMNCTCPDGMFSCGCFRTNPVTCDSETGCIPIALVNDQHIDCADKSDEPLLKSVHSTKCGSCSLLLYKLERVENCDLIGFPTCDNSTCISIPVALDGEAFDFICTSYCPPENRTRDCDEFFQCEDEGIILLQQFCDGNFDCSDKSDEVNDSPGFKCKASENSTRQCFVPEANLYDEVAQCYDKTDLCLHGRGPPCYKCFDNGMPLAPTQVCDGILDCHDLSDECLCRDNFKLPICKFIFSQNDPENLHCDISANCYPSSIYTSQAYCLLLQSSCRDTTCYSKYGSHIFTWCDGIPECKYIQDECYCPDPPKFCKDPCRNYLSMNDRYCDGVNDPAWVYINDSRCPIGFDERDCPKRFYCLAKGKVSIKDTRKCDGTVDCDDGSDENDCTQAVNDKLFSSATEMISNVPLRVAFWVMGLATMTGNLYVIVTTLNVLRKKNKSDMAVCNHILILNLSIADLLMGFYLLMIAVKSVQFSGVYGMYDYEWRTSATCTGAGILAIISSETSCFLMTILTSFRLYTVAQPMKSRTASTTPWKVAVCTVWLLAILLAVAPTLRISANYFANEVWLPGNHFFRSEGAGKNDVTNFACRLASLTSTTITPKGSNWESTLVYLSANFPQFLPRADVGYYGETSVCMPRFYVTYGDNGWEYSFAIITVNFISFMYVVVGYIFIYRRAFNRKIRSSNKEDKSNKMQKRIARLIATDFCCWIPICIFAYLNLGGVPLKPVFYVVSAAILLPVNSALNPLLYSPLIEKVQGKFSRLIRSQHAQTGGASTLFSTKSPVATETDRVDEKDAMMQQTSNNA